MHQAGWPVVAACRLAGLSCRGYYTTRHACRTPVPVSDPSAPALMARIRAVTEAHPFWGYRRVWAWLRYRENL